jgi:hypothetical protein
MESISSIKNILKFYIDGLNHYDYKFWSDISIQIYPKIEKFIIPKVHC